MSTDEGGGGGQSYGAKANASALRLETAEAVPGIILMVLITDKLIVRYYGLCSDDPCHKILSITNIACCLSDSIIARPSGV